MVPMRPERSVSTRDRLLVAARQLFGEQGYAATSTRAIARRADCNVSLIKHYFGSKDGLLRQSLLHGVTTVGDELRALRACEAPARERIERFVGFMIDYFDRFGDVMRIVDRELLQTRKPIGEEVRALAKGNMDLLAEILLDLRKEGRLRDVDPRTAAILLMGMIKIYFVAYPLTSRLVGRKSPRVIAKLKREVTRIFLDGVLK